MMTSLRAFLAVALLSAPSMAADPAPALTDAQKAEVQAVVRDLLANREPEIVIKAITTFQEREKAAQERNSAESLTKNKAQLFNDPNSPVLGNPKGDVTLVAFFDYQCGYCKMAHATLKDLIASDKDLRVVIKEFPILGIASETAARAALASVNQGKYAPFHDALMEFRGQYSEAVIVDIAKKVGLNTDKLQKDMKDKKIDAIIDGDRKLASAMNVRGTPLFIIGDKTFPGALDKEEMKAAIEGARAPKNAP